MRPWCSCSSASRRRCFAQAPVSYRLSFPEAEHRLMQVEVSFDELPPGPLELRMSRSSPDATRCTSLRRMYSTCRLRMLPAARSRWFVRPRISGTFRRAPGRVRVTYRVYGDRVDGTYSESTARTRTSTCRQR